MKTKIVTARMEEEVFHQIEYLKNQLGTNSTTGILKEAVHNLYNSFKKKEIRKSPFELLDELNLIGCIQGKKDLSVNYKKEITKSLVKKHQKRKKNRVK